MKVVLFCGGLGTRLRDYSDSVPKPMVTIGYRPVLWHVMKYYAHFGHKDFILCLGYRGDQIKEYFLRYDETISNDFVLGDGDGLRLMNTDIHDWRITFADTGISSSIGQRLRAVRPYLEGEDVFLANYADGLTDLPLPGYIEAFRASGKLASFLCVKSSQTFHVVSARGDGVVTGIEPINESDVWINGGYFAFRKEIFDHIGEGEDLVDGPFTRLIAAEQLLAHKYAGFWAAMDTFRDRQWLARRYEAGDAPWEIWKHAQPVAPARATAEGR